MNLSWHMPRQRFLLPKLAKKSNFYLKFGPIFSIIEVAITIILKTSVAKRQFVLSLADCKFCKF